MRIAAKRRRGPLVWLAYRLTERRLGRVGEPVQAIAYHGPVMLGSGALQFALEHSQAVPERLKLLATLKASSVAGCPWCLDVSSILARDQGVTERQLRDLASFRDSEAFSPLEQLVLAYAEAMTRTPASVPDALFENLRAELDERQLVELTAAIAWENFGARFNRALDIRAQDFSQGAYCPTPERMVGTGSLFHPAPD